MHVAQLQAGAGEGGGAASGGAAAAGAGGFLSAPIYDLQQVGEVYSGECGARGRQLWRVCTHGTRCRPGRQVVDAGGAAGRQQLEAGAGGGGRGGAR